MPRCPCCLAPQGIGTCSTAALCLPKAVWTTTVLHTKQGLSQVPSGQGSFWNSPSLSLPWKILEWQRIKPPVFHPHQELNVDRG